MVQSIVVLEKDPKIALLLAGCLRPRFNVHIADSNDELREKLTKSSPEAVVVSIEHWRLKDVESLHHEFPALSIVCTHRVPDEEMWMAALEAGASDVCPADDTENVLSSVLRSLATSRGVAA